MAFCGDVVDYGPQPVECLHWVRENADHAVRGNHDNAVGFDMDCRCMGTFREYSVATRAWTAPSWITTITSSCDSCRRWIVFEWEGKHFRMAHATPQGDLFEYLSMEQWRDRIVGLDADFILLGHTHVQGCGPWGRLPSSRRGAWAWLVTAKGKPAMCFPRRPDAPQADPL